MLYNKQLRMIEETKKELVADLKDMGWNKEMLGTLITALKVEFHMMEG